MRASLLEIDQTVVSWPQLAADVVLGGAVGAQTARRVLLGEDIPSGRHYIDVESCIEGKAAARICGSANARVASACYGKDYLQRVVGSLPKAQDAAELDRSL